MELLIKSLLPHRKTQISAVFACDAKRKRNGTASEASVAKLQQLGGRTRSVHTLVFAVHAPAAEAFEEDQMQRWVGE